MNITDQFQKVLRLLKSNSPEILTALGVSGVVTTAYFTHKAAVEAHKQLEAKDQHCLSNKEKAKIVWKLYIPPGISGAATIGCIIASSKASTKRTTAAVAAYSLTERAFTEYKERVVDQIGKNAEQKIRDDIAQETVTNNPPNSKEVIILGKGDVLCCELYTRRYFKSNMDMLRKAENQINAKIISDVYVPLDDFYEILGLPYTSHSAHWGWDSDILMKLEFSATISENDEPCLAFGYNYVKPLK